MSDVCMPGTMFISRAPSRSLCFNIIFLVAVAVRQSGNMKVFVDLSSVSSNLSASSSGPAPKVAPQSKIRWLAFACADKTRSVLVVGSLLCSYSYALT